MTCTEPKALYTDKSCAFVDSATTPPFDVGTSFAPTLIAETPGRGSPEAQRIRCVCIVGNTTARLYDTALALIGIPHVPRTWKLTVVPPAIGDDVFRVSNTRQGVTV